MKILLLFTVCTAILILTNYNEPPTPSTPVPLRAVHGGNYRSEQLSLIEMDTLLQQYGGDSIKVVIRLNGDGKDGGGVTIEEEAQLCAKHRVRFYLLNAHAKDTPVQVAALLSNGGVWMHCLHGFDRTGAMVAYWLLLNGYTKAQVIKHNGWENYSEKGAAYQRKYYKFVNQ